MAILVIVDMQKEFAAARDPSLIRRIVKAIKHHKGPICLLRYTNDIDGPGIVGHSDCFPSILRACEGKKVYRCLKEHDDGSAVVVGAAYREGLGRHRTFIMCGVNTAWCVGKTALGILKLKKKSKLIMPIWLNRNQLDGPDHLVTETVLSVFCRENKKRRKLTWHYPFPTVQKR